jgi:anti-sigma factor RsiW
VPAKPEYPNTSPPEPSGPTYSARIALSCERDHAPGQVLHALQELRSAIDDRLRRDLSSRYDRHSTGSVGTDKITVTFTLRAASDADAIRSAGLAAGTLAEILSDNAVAIDLSGVALVVRAQ